MKKIYLFLVFALASTQLVAQSNSNNISKKNFELTRFDFGVGIDYDHFALMSYNRLTSFAANPVEIKRDLSNFEEESSITTAGASFYMNLAFSPISYKYNKVNFNQELRFGLGIHSNKEAMVSFKNEDLDTSLVFCNLHDELSLETAYVFNKKLGKRFSLYAGLSGNLGVTSNNEMLIISGKYFEEGEHPSNQEFVEQNIERFKANTMVYSRVFVPYGINYSMKKWTLGLDIRRGFGFQKVLNQPANYLKKTGSFVVGFKYAL